MLPMTHTEDRAPVSTHFNCISSGADWGAEVSHCFKYSFQPVAAINQVLSSPNQSVRKKSFQKEILRKLKFNQKRTNRTQICEDPKKFLLVPFCAEDILREIEAALT